MIRGAEQAFKFKTSFNFDDICNIVAVFSQPHNNGTASAPMPITKYYDKQVTKIDIWDEANKDDTKTYYVGRKYYSYNGRVFKSSDIRPEESDVLGGTITSWPLGEDCQRHKTYKCDKSYYQYNPGTYKWDISDSVPNADLVELLQVGAENIPANADKKKAHVYNRRYYQHDGSEWQESRGILPIEEISYWDNTKTTYDTNKVYCALETYHKYVDGSWQAYGRDDIMPTEICAWNSTDTSIYDKAKIYMLEEIYYQHNTETGQLEKTEVRKVYYRYNDTESKWEQCEEPDLAIEDLNLWSEDDANDDKYDEDKIYVCKDVYYRYNAASQRWEGSHNMLGPIVEIDSWIPADYHDPSKIYVCPERYYQYDIKIKKWKEVAEVKQPQIVILDYWAGLDNYDENTIYLCGPTYYQYDSKSQEWMSSANFNIQLVQINYPNEAIDQSKVYECSPIYYAYKGGAWRQYKNAADAVRNDGFSVVDGEPKSFVAMLSAEETMRFSERYKGCVQVTVYCDTVNRTEKSHVEYFSVHPTITDEVFNYTPSDAAGATNIFDAGRVI